jgi:hypothetical protein
MVLGVVGNIIYISLEGLPTELALAAGSQAGTKQGTVFVTGLLAGCVTFGGAFTAVPCVPAARAACAARCHLCADAPAARAPASYVFRSLVTLSGYLTPQQARAGAPRRASRTPCHGASTRSRAPPPFAQRSF